MRFVLFVNALVSSAFFGMWLESWKAGMFFMMASGFVLSMIDYAKGHDK